MLQDFYISAEQSVFAIHPIHTFGVTELLYGKAALELSLLEVHFALIYGDAVLQVGVLDSLTPLATKIANF